MKITLISSNDLLGGAGIVTYSLMQALRELGHDARMVVAHKYSDSPSVIVAGSAFSRRAAFLSERLGIFLRNGLSRRYLFRVSTATRGLPLHRIPEVRDADAILLGWINQGLLSLDEIGRLSRMGKRMVWTMHDMWCMTGICHHAYGCPNFRIECGGCKFLNRAASSSDLSHIVWRRKRGLYDSVAISFVAVSNWVRDRAAESLLLRDVPVEVIHNPYPVDDFYPAALNGQGSVAQAGKHRIVFGAANLSDPVKGLDIAIDALNRFADLAPDLAAETEVAFFGAVRNPDVFGRLRIPCVSLGMVKGNDALRAVYQSADVVLSASRYETLGGTLVEGMACGAVPVSFGEGGQVDFITHLRNGYIARYLDSSDLATGIRWAISARKGIHTELSADYSDIAPSALHAHVSDLFSPRAVALRYLALLQ